MNHKIQTLLWMMIFILSACTQKETISYSLKSDIYGEIETFSETSQERLHDYGGVQIKVAGTNPEITVFSDTSGFYSIPNLPFGTYKFIVSKDGYGEYQLLDYTVMGGSKPRKLYFSLYQKSKTIINNYDLKITDGLLNIKGNLSFGFSEKYLDYFFIWPKVAIYMSTSPDVSSTHFQYYTVFQSTQADPKVFDINLSFDKTVYPSGSTMYIVLGGKNPIYNENIYDFETNTSYDPCIGVLSEVKSIIIP